MEDATKQTTVSEEQLNTWKQKHGENSILKIELRDKIVYLLDPEQHKNYFHMVKRAMQFSLREDLFKLWASNF